MSASLTPALQRCGPALITLCIVAAADGLAASLAAVPAPWLVGATIAVSGAALARVAVAVPRPLSEAADPAFVALHHVFRLLLISLALPLLVRRLSGSLARSPLLAQQPCLFARPAAVLLRLPLVV